MHTTQTLILVAMSCLAPSIHAQVTCPPRDLNLMTQSRIDSFPLLYPDCHAIEGDLIIEEREPGNIRNLDSLYSVTEIRGDLIIGSYGWRGNQSLRSLHGLHNLTTIGGSLHLAGNPALTDLEGLHALTTIGGDCKIGLRYPDVSTPEGNESLQNLAGLHHLQSIGGTLLVAGNPQLSHLSALSSLQNIGESLVIMENHNLTGLDGLDQLKSLGRDLLIWENAGIMQIKALARLTAINGHLDLRSNPLLASLEGLHNITSVSGRVSIRDHAGLVHLGGLDKLQVIGQFLTLSNNTHLQSLHGLEHLEAVGWGCYLMNLPVLRNLDGLEQLRTIGQLGDGWNGFLFIDNNTTLNNLRGLKGLATLGGGLYLGNNDALISLSGLGALTSIGSRGIDWGKLTIVNNLSLLRLAGMDNLDPATIDHLVVKNNRQLNVCSTEPICAYLDADGPAEIAFNASGCGNIEAINRACHELRIPVAVSGDASAIPEFEVSIFPNPTAGIVRITCDSRAYPIRVTCFDIQGTLLIQSVLTNEADIHLDAFPPGTYLVNLATADTQLTFRVIRL